MRAVICREWGELDTLTLGEMPAPAPGAGEVLIEVRATAVNYADALLVAGRYQTRPERPFSPGLETAGVVAACGAGVTRFSVGDRVMAVLPYGGLAEMAVAPEAETFAIPAGMSFEEAGAFPIAYISSHVAIRWQGRLEAGETMLVLGAAGGVGLTAVEIGKAMGARVIAAASTAEKLAVAREHGADAIINYATEKLTERVMALTGDKGVDVCFDPVGGDLFDAALSSLGRTHLAGRLRRRGAADPGQSPAGQAPRGAGLLAALLPLARARQAASLRRGAAGVVGAGEAAPADLAPPAAGPHGGGDQAPDRSPRPRQDRRRAGGTVAAWRSASRPTGHTSPSSPSTTSRAATR
jgi:NADPH2:quinone reductase